MGVLGRSRTPSRLGPVAHNIGVGISERPGPFRWFMKHGPCLAATPTPSATIAGGTSVGVNGFRACGVPVAADLVWGFSTQPSR